MIRTAYNWEQMVQMVKNLKPHETIALIGHLSDITADDHDSPLIFSIMDVAKMPELNAALTKDIGTMFNDYMVKMKK
jgi:hypothetical protein